MEVSGTRIRVGGVISESFDLYRQHAAVLILSALVIFVVAGVLQGLLAEGGGLILSLVSVVVGSVAAALYTGFVVKLVQDIRADGARDFTASELASAAAPAIVPLILNGIIKGIAIAIGLVLLIVPGLILLTIWAVTSPAIVAERAGVFGAFSRSMELVRGHGWPVFGVILVAFLITFGISLVAGLIGAEISFAALLALSIVAAIVTAPISALVSAILFFDLGGSPGESAGAEPAYTPPAV